MGNGSSADTVIPAEKPVQERLYYNYVQQMKDHDFEIENIVLEGGGAKGYAYCGAIQALEDIGIWRKVKRVAGASAGAICASILCVGYTSTQLRNILNQAQDNPEIFLDHTWGLTTWVRNLCCVLCKFGWHNGDKFLDFLGQIFKDKCGDADVTFLGVYEKYGKELCVVVTNVNRMDAEYCHMKTTPHMPVRVAVRMSMSIPFMFQAVPFDMWNPVKIVSRNYYIDGGVLCNYPLHSFDGWYLSMKDKDSFLNKMVDIEDLNKLFDIKERFGKRNKNTLGFLVYSDDEGELFRPQLDQRQRKESEDIVRKVPLDEKKQNEFPVDESDLSQLISGKQGSDEDSQGMENMKDNVIVLPDTPLARQFKAKREENKDLLKNAYAFLKGLKSVHSVSHDNHQDIRREDFEKLIDEPDLKGTVEYLFGAGVTAGEVYRKIKMGNDTHEGVQFIDISRYLKLKGLDLRSHFLGYEPKQISGLLSFSKAVIEGMLKNGQRSLASFEDLKRTVGINTRYITTVTSDMSLEDREFLITEGRRAAITFLHNKYTNQPVYSWYYDYVGIIAPFADELFQKIPLPKEAKPIVDNILDIVTNDDKAKPIIDNIVDIVSKGVDVMASSQITSGRPAEPTTSAEVNAGPSTDQLKGHGREEPRTRKEMQYVI